MKIRMLKHIGSKVDGVAMGPYFEGQEYDIDADRAALFISSAIAEEVKPPVVEAAIPADTGTAVAADPAPDIPVSRW